MFNLDLNVTGKQHILAMNGRYKIITPRRQTQSMRRSLESVRGLAIIAVVLLDCSPSFVTEWQQTLESRFWLGEQVDVLATRKSKTWQGKLDAILLVNKRASYWAVNGPEGNVYVKDERRLR